LSEKEKKIEGKANEIFQIFRKFVRSQIAYAVSATFIQTSAQSVKKSFLKEKNS
jgi:hypothetical protein